MAFFTSRSASPLAAASGRAYHWLAVVFFIGLALVYYLPSLSWMPRGIHEWAQADRLALAISFYDHGLNLFRPQTLNISAIDGVVGVEFPLVAWLVALLAKLTGRGSLVLWFHLVDISIAVTGYYYLFRLVFERSGNFVAALLPGVFLATAPAFAYYAGNYLPDPVGASLAVVGAYYLLRFGRAPRFADLLRALGLLTLATLIKTSTGTYQVAAIGLVLLWSYLQLGLLSLRQKLVFLALSALSLGAVVAYARYNTYLNETYRSFIFLARARPLETEQQYQDVLQRIRDIWWPEYFTSAHYFLLKCSVVLCVLFGWRIVRTEWLWASLLALAAVGGYAFFRLMGLQFFDHDYYALAPYYPGLGGAPATGPANSPSRTSRGGHREPTGPRAALLPRPRERALRQVQRLLYLPLDAGRRPGPGGRAGAHQRHPAGAGRGGAQPSAGVLRPPGHHLEARHARLAARGPDEFHAHQRPRLPAAAGRASGAAAAPGGPVSAAAAHQPLCAAGPHRAHALSGRYQGPRACRGGYLCGAPFASSFS